MYIYIYIPLALSLARVRTLSLSLSLSLCLYVCLSLSGATNQDLAVLLARRRLELCHFALENDKGILGSRNSTRACYIGTLLIRNTAPLGPYSRNMPRALWRS